MIALGLSIVVSTLLFSCFRLFPKYGVRLEEAVVVNYMVAGTLAVAMAGPSHAWERMGEPSTAAGVAMGLIFLYMFKKIGECTQKNGAWRRGHCHQDVHGAAHDGVHVPGPQ